MENPFRDETKRSKKRKKAAKATLSFALDDDDEGEDSATFQRDRSSSKEEEDEFPDDPPAKRGKFRKNPHVDTSFLPDREREEAERKERERLRLEWLEKQEAIKKEDIEVVYSYWDGSGHRKSVTVIRMTYIHCIYQFRFQCKKGDDIASFLEKCRQQFPELRGVSVDNLMYIKVGSTSYDQTFLIPSFLQEDLIIPHVGFTFLHVNRAF